MTEKSLKTFFFSLPKLWFCNFYSKILGRTRKSLSSSYEQIKEFNDFQFKYFPLKSEKKRFHFFLVYIYNPGHDTCIYSTV